VKAIPLGRATTLIPYLNFLSGLGAPVQRGLEREHLPVGLIERPTCYIPTRNNWAFLDRMAREEGIPDLGFRVAYGAGTHAMSAELIGRLCRAPTLLRAIEIFCESVHRDSSGMRCWLTPQRKAMRFQMVKSFGPSVPGFAQTEWLGLMGMMEVIRLFAGPAWQPREISLRAPGPVSRLAHELLPYTHILKRDSCSYINFNRSLLGLCRPTRVHLSPRSPSTPTPFAKPATDFLSSVRQIMHTYLMDGYPHIELTAEIAGTSVRSLQRSLSGAGVTYSTLIEEVRLEAATAMLTETDARSIEIAHTLGYKDSANFARAFRRLTGMSPREFRQSALDRDHALARGARDEVL